MNDATPFTFCEWLHQYAKGAYLIDLITGEFGVSKEILTSKQMRRSNIEVVQAKQIACYLLTKYTALPRRQIMILLGYNDKTIVTKSVKTLDKIMSGNRALKAQIENAEQNISQCWK